MAADSSRYRRGQVWMVIESDIINRKEGVQSGNRPYLIVSSDEGNETSTAVTALACTTNKERSKYRINVTYRSAVHNTDSVILCNQVRTFSLQDLNKARYIETISDDVMSKVDEAFMLAMGISKKFNGTTIEELKRVVNEIAEESINNSNISNNVTEDMIIDIAMGLESIFSRARSDKKRKINETKRNIGDVNEGLLLLHKSITERPNNNNATEDLTESTDSDDSSASEDSQESKNTSIEPTKKKRRKWTEESMMQFVEDKKNMKIDDFVSKYGFKDAKSAISMHYQIVYKLRKMGKEV